MKRLDYQVSFTTPAFLGDAEQNGRWRTPPFKALLRQWWRVAYAEDHGFQVNVAGLRREEGSLFGNAWLSHHEGNREVTDHCKSLLRIRLDRWDTGKLTNWPAPDAAVTHPEVKNREGRVVPVGSQLYLGYGPLTFRNGTALKANAAIQAGETGSLSLAFPDEHAALIETALWLVDRYGTVGGRSRNGWGSFSLTPTGETPPLKGRLPARPWGDALDLDWPHAIGADAKPLIWQTRAFDDWKPLMRELAIIKIGLRTQFVFPNVKPPHQAIEPRHWLSYPITKHSTYAWDRGARLPNSLRFKVRPAADDPAKLVGVIAHVPCQPPASFGGNRRALMQTWQAVHDLLDELTLKPPSRTYPSISDAGRRTQLKPQLDTAFLRRTPE